MSYKFNPFTGTLDRDTDYTTVLDSRYLKLDASNDPITGSLLIQPTTDSLTALVVNDKDSNNVLTVDTINNRVGIGIAAPRSSLEIIKDLITTATTEGLSLTNTTLSTVGVPIQNAPAIKLNGNYWISSANSSYNHLLQSTPVGTDLRFSIKLQKGVAAYTTIFQIDQNGSFVTSIKKSFYDIREVLTDGLQMFYDWTSGKSTVSYDQYSPQIRMSGGGWSTGSGADQTMTLQQVVAPEQGVTNPTGVYKYVYGTNSQTATETNEIMRMEWGERLGVLFNKNNAANYTLNVLGNVGIGITAPTAKLHIVGSSDTQQLIVKANATQTTNLQEWQDNGGTALTVIKGDGKLSLDLIDTATSGTLRGAFLRLNPQPGSASSASHIGFQGQITGLYNNSTSGYIAGVYGSIYASPATTKTIAWASGVQSRVNNAGAGTITNAALFRGEQLQDGLFTNAYGLYLPSIAAGATLNYAIYTNAGANSLGDILLLRTIKSGATQAGAGAVANEVWKTASHATLPDNVLMIGV